MSDAPENQPITREYLLGLTLTAASAGDKDAIKSLLEEAADLLKRDIKHQSLF